MFVEYPRLPPPVEWSWSSQIGSQSLFVDPRPTAKYLLRTLTSLLSSHLHSIPRVERPYTVSNCPLWLHIRALAFGVLFHPLANINSKFLLAIPFTFVAWFLCFEYCLQLPSVCQDVIFLLFLSLLYWYSYYRGTAIWFIPFFSPQMGKFRTGADGVSLDLFPGHFHLCNLVASGPALAFSFSKSRLPKFLCTFLRVYDLPNSGGGGYVMVTPTWRCMTT